MATTLVWIMVNLAHSVPYGASYAYPFLATCQHAMDVFNRSPSAWTCRSITVVSDGGEVCLHPPPSTATLLRGKRNAAYDEARLRAITAHPAIPSSAP